MRILLSVAFVLSLTAIVVLPGCGGRGTNPGRDTINNDGWTVDIIGMDLTGLDLNGLDLNSLQDGWISEGGVAKIQQTTLSVVCPPEGVTEAPAFQNGETGLVMDVVVTAGKLEASAKLDRYFVADAGLTRATAFSGAAMTVEKTLGLPDFAVGDVLTITADHLEYYCTTQIEATAAARLDTGKTLNPVEIDPAAIGGQDAAAAEKWEGVLVKLKDVAVTNENLGYGQFEVTGGVVISPAYDFTYQAAPTDSFDEIVGVVDYSYGKYVLLPRSNSDIVLKGGQPADVIEPGDMIAPPDIQYDLPEGVEPPSSLIDLQSSTTSTGCSTVSAIKTITEGLTLKGLVVVTPKYVAKTDKLDGYYVCQGMIDPVVPYSCMAMAIDVAAPEKFEPGDIINVEGKYIEYYCFSEISATSATAVGSVAVPEPLAIEPADLGTQNTAMAEPLEGVLVTVQDVEIIETPANGSDGKDHGAFKVTGDLIVGNDFYLEYMRSATDGRAVGQKFLSITGVVAYSFGRYEIMPRTLDDLAFDGDPIIVEKDLSDVIVPDVEVTTGGYTMNDIQTMVSSTGCSADGFVNVLDGVAFAPVIITTPKFSASAVLDGYYAEDYPISGTRNSNGMAIVAPKTLNTAWVPGDVISMTQADYYEYYCMSQVEIVAAAKISTAAAPVAVNISAALLENGGLDDKAAMEPYEGMLVKITGGSITNAAPSDEKTWFVVGSEIQISNQFFIEDFTPVNGKAITSITGVIRYHFGKYRLAPRTAADIVIID